MYSLSLANNCKHQEVGATAGVPRVLRIMPTLSLALPQAPDSSLAKAKAVVYKPTIEPRGTERSEGPHETKRFRSSLTSQVYYEPLFIFYLFILDLILFTEVLYLTVLFSPLIFAPFPSKHSFAPVEERFNGSG